MKGAKVDWVQISDFLDYSVHFTGIVRKNSDLRVMALQQNQHGVINVGLYRDGRQYKRSVAVLVAEAFLPRAVPETFDTPIHLDGDLANNHVENLMWRPRWFARAYHQQFDNPIRLERVIQDCKTGERFKNSRAVCTTYGLLEGDLQMSMVRETYVWPTYQEFQVVGG